MWSASRLQQHSCSRGRDSMTSRGIPSHGGRRACCCTRHLPPTLHNRHWTLATPLYPQRWHYATLTFFYWPRFKQTLPKQIELRLAAGLWQFLRVPLPRRRTGRGAGLEARGQRGEDRSDRRLRLAPNYTRTQNTMQAATVVPLLRPCSSETSGSESLDNTGQHAISRFHLHRTSASHAHRTWWQRYHQ